jgi:hypothetical protein
MNALGNMPAKLYFSRPMQRGFHNLTNEEMPHPGTHSLLGLGLNFCPVPKLRHPTDLFDLPRFQRDVFVKYFFYGGPPLPPTKLYLRSEWSPPPKELPLKVLYRTRRACVTLKSLLPRRPRSHLVFYLYSGQLFTSYEIVIPTP